MINTRSKFVKLIHLALWLSLLVTAILPHTKTMTGLMDWCLGNRLQRAAMEIVLGIGQIVGLHIHGLMFLLIA